VAVTETGSGTVERVVEVPAETTVTEAVDERGVPYKNLVAELERKLGEAAEQNTKYQQALGYYAQQYQAPAPQPAPVAEDVEARFDEPTKKFVTQVAAREAKRIAYELVTQANAQQNIGNDQEIQQEATRWYQALKVNPLYSTDSDIKVWDRAVAEARVSVLGRRMEAASKATAAATVRDAAAATQLPPTRGNNEPSATDRDKFIAEFIKDDENRRMVRKLDRVDPDSEEGQRLLKETAELNWREPIKLSPKIKLAAEAFKQGQVNIVEER